MSLAVLQLRSRVRIVTGVIVVIALVLIFGGPTVIKRTVGTLITVLGFLVGLARS